MLATDDDVVDTALIPTLAPPVGHSLRSRHATPESKAAILVMVAACALCRANAGHALHHSHYTARHA